MHACCSCTAAWEGTALQGPSRAQVRHDACLNHLERLRAGPAVPLGVVSRAAPLAQSGALPFPCLVATPFFLQLMFARRTYGLV